MNILLLILLITASHKTFGASAEMQLEKQPDQLTANLYQAIADEESSIADNLVAVQTLINQGAQINSLTSIKTLKDTYQLNLGHTRVFGNHISPLHLACAALKPELVTLLLENNADVNIKDGHHCVPLTHAFINMTRESYEEDIKEDQEEYDEMMAHKEKDEENGLKIIKILLESKANRRTKFVIPLPKTDISQTYIQEINGITTGPLAIPVPGTDISNPSTLLAIVASDQEAMTNTTYYRLLNLLINQPDTHLHSSLEHYLARKKGKKLSFIDTSDNTAFKGLIEYLYYYIKKSIANPNIYFIDIGIQPYFKLLMDLYEKDGNGEKHYQKELNDFRDKKLDAQTEKLDEQALLILCDFLELLTGESDGLNPDDAGNTPLHRAIQFGNYYTVLEIFKKNSPSTALNKVNSKNKTPLDLVKERNTIIAQLENQINEENFLFNMLRIHFLNYLRAEYKNTGSGLKSKVGDTILHGLVKNLSIFTNDELKLEIEVMLDVLSRAPFINLLQTNNANETALDIAIKKSQQNSDTQYEEAINILQKAMQLRYNIPPQVRQRPPLTMHNAHREPLKNLIPAKPACLIKSSNRIGLLKPIKYSQG